MNLDNHIIVVIGLGYVGLPLAVEFGKKRPVIGFDINEKRIYELNKSYDRTMEVSEKEISDAKYIKFTSKNTDVRSCSSEKIKELSNSKQAVNKYIFIVTVPTPVDKAKRPDLSPIIKASEIVGSLLKAGDVVIYESTVYPGATEEVCVPILEHKSGLSCKMVDGEDDGNIHFHVGYSPERINPGDKSHRLNNIKKITSGSNIEVAKAINKLYQEIIIAGTHLASSIKVAEAAKVIENTQRDINIAFVNELAVIFNLIGIDTTEVLAAASTKWNFMSFKPGLVGGHCIGVDPYYLTHKAQELGYSPQVILSGRTINDNMGKFAAYNVIRLMIKNNINVSKATIGVFGVTFKENCPDIRNSKVIDIVQELRFWGINVLIIDPLADSAELNKEYGLSLTEFDSNMKLNSIIVAVAHKQFEKFKVKDLRKLCYDEVKPVFGDLKSLYNQNELKEQGFEVFRF